MAVRHIVWSGLSLFDEYGNPITVKTTNTGALTYGWLGGKERATDTTGLVLMGVRLYNSVTGHFTSVDPVKGGNTTRYAYPQDPINQLDLDGKASWWSRNWKKVAVGAAVVVAVGATCYFATAACGVAVRAGTQVVKRVATKSAVAATRSAKVAAKPIKKTVQTIKTKVKKNNFIRIGPTTKGKPFRVSLGPAPKHFKKLSPAKQKIMRYSVHLEKKTGIFYRHHAPEGKKRTVLWGKEKKCSSRAIKEIWMDQNDFSSTLQGIFADEIKRILPQANYETSIRDGEIFFALNVNGNREFEINSWIPFISLNYSDSWYYLGDGYDDDPEGYIEDFPEQVSILLGVVAKYCANELIVKESKTRFLRHRTLLFCDLRSGQNYEFRRFRLNRLNCEEVGSNS